MQLSKHYFLNDLTKSATADKKGLDNIPTIQVINNLSVLCEKVLEPIYAAFGKRARINSGYRSYEINKAVGGAKNSQHMKGEAADIELDSTSNQVLYDFIKDSLIYDQLILENHHKEVPSSGWVHVSYSQVRNRNDAR